MRTEDFDYELPERLIAQRPLPERDSSRLLCISRESGDLDHRRFLELPTLLQRPSLLVVNDTRVFPARLRGVRPTGGQAELLLLKRVDGGADGNTGAGNDTATERWRCLGKPRRKLKPGATVEFEGVSGLVLEADGDGLTVELSAPKGLRNVLSQHGRIPLPPYIRRADDSADHERYQTIFAGASEGSVAAPTAGLHFTDEVLSALEAAGHRHTSVTLHVGPGTFLPVRVESLEEHTMHGEWIDVSDEVVGEIEDARRDGRQIIAVGTTVVRALESAAAQVGGFGPLRGETELFIVPGHEFRIVQGLITNFHLPKSTLLALVSAFAGRDLVLEAYRQAVRREYRFYSYGDAMLIQ